MRSGITARSGIGLAAGLVIFAAVRVVYVSAPPRPEESGIVEDRAASLSAASVKRIARRSRQIPSPLLDSIRAIGLEPNPMRQEDSLKRLADSTAAGELVSTIEDLERQESTELLQDFKLRLVRHWA